MRCPTNLTIVLEVVIWHSSYFSFKSHLALLSLSLSAIMTHRQLDAGRLSISKSMSSIPESNISHFQHGVDTIRHAKRGEIKIQNYLDKAHVMYNSGQYKESLSCCEECYEIDAFRTDNLLLLGAIHFQLRNFSESIFYNQQCIRVDPSHAEAFSNMGNALKELGDIQAAIQFYLKVRYFLSLCLSLYLSFILSLSLSLSLLGSVLTSPSGN
jgi:tetratricopeptide (TPR) repeat protein